MMFGLKNCIFDVILLLREGSSHDRGLYARCFEELSDLANLDFTCSSRCEYSVTVFELYNNRAGSFSCHFGIFPF